MLNNIKTLPINFETFGFVEREQVNGKIVRNKCGRDFLYYALHYYFPEKFNKNINNPTMIDKSKIFGFPMNVNLAWLMIQFFKVPTLCKELGLSLSIGDRKVNTFGNFITSIINPNHKSIQEAINDVENSIDHGFVTGVDLSMHLFGLIDHVMFVYGYDKENLYVFDTHQVPSLEYEKITRGNKFIMRLPKATIKKRWTRLGRVWVVKKISNT